MHTCFLGESSGELGSCTEQFLWGLAYAKLEYLKRNKSWALAAACEERPARKVQMHRALDSPGGIWRTFGPAVSQAEVTVWWDVNGESTWLPSESKPILPSCFTASCGKDVVAGVAISFLTWCSHTDSITFHDKQIRSVRNNLGNTSWGKEFDLRKPQIQT